MGQVYWQIKEKNIFGIKDDFKGESVIIQKNGIHQRCARSSMKQIQEIPILGRKSSRSCQSIRKGGVLEEKSIYSCHWRKRLQKSTQSNIRCGVCFGSGIYRKTGEPYRNKRFN